MPTWAIAKKEARLFLRDPRAAILLLAMPLIFILILGLTVGEGFGQKPDDRLRVSLLDLDKGHTNTEAALLEAGAWLGGLSPPAPGGVNVQPLAAQALAGYHYASQFPFEPWASVMRRDLEQTADIRVEIIQSLEEAE